MIPVDLDEWEIIKFVFKKVSKDYKTKVFNNLGINVMDRVNDTLSKKMVGIDDFKIKGQRH